MMLSYFCTCACAQTNVKFVVFVISLSIALVHGLYAG